MFHINKATYLLFTPSKRDCFWKIYQTFCKLFGYLNNLRILQNKNGKYVKSVLSVLVPKLHLSSMLILFITWRNQFFCYFYLKIIFLTAEDQMFITINLTLIHYFIQRRAPIQYFLPCHLFYLTFQLIQFCLIYNLDASFGF